MLKTLKQKQRKYFSKTIVPGKTLKEVIYQGEGYQTSVLIIDQQQTISTCLRCKDPKCKTYLDDEFSLTLLQDFPSDTKSDTCCVDAIKWDLFDSVPHIEEEKCIGCGVCIERCPVGAIFFTNSRLAINISDIDSSEMINNLNDFANPQLQDVIYQGVKVPITQDSISSLYNNINNKSRFGGPKLPNILVRNLFRSLGFNCHIRRNGDTNIRTDLIIEEGELLAVCEIEFGDDTLNSPRNILDNIAVVSNRYNIPVENIIPIIVALTLPRQRQEYWQVISDIKTVLKIEIKTITIGALFSLLSSSKKVTLSDIAEFYIDSDHSSIREALSGLIGDINIPEGFYAVLEADK
jgi:ferredoxin